VKELRGTETVDPKSVKRLRGTVRIVPDSVRVGALANIDNV
jgi:hypothetical protein